MKISVLASNLNWALGIVGKGVAVRPQLPILGNVLIKANKEGLELITTDLEIGFRVKVGAKVEQEGEIGLPARLLTELMATINDGVVEISVEKEVAKIVSGKIKASLNAVVAGEFPSIPKFKGEANFVLNGSDLSQVISQVSISASKDDSRPVFTGILWSFEESGIKLVATDGYRLGIGGLKLEKKSDKELKKIIIPAKSLQELVKVSDKESDNKIEVKVEEEKQQIIFKIKEIELTSRLLSGEFPPYGQILPQVHKIKAELDREELTEAIKRSAIFARESANIIKLTVKNNQVTVSTNGTQSGSSETEVEAKTEGEDLVVAFNSRYLLDYLNGVGAPIIEFRSEGSLKPGVFVEAGKKESFLQVIMPVRVQD